MINFTRGGMPFQAEKTNKSCVFMDLTNDVRFELPYAFEVQKIEIITKSERRNRQESVRVLLDFGLETLGGQWVEVKENDSWLLPTGHIDLESFAENLGPVIFNAVINGFVKHYMPNSQKYRELPSQFLGVLDDQGQVIEANND